MITPPFFNLYPIILTYFLIFVQFFVYKNHILIYIIPKYGLYFYSLLNASTGSFLAAVLDGIIPPINVRTTLSITSVIAP